MKNIMTFGTIVAVHVVALAMIAVQPACSSSQDIQENQNNRNKNLNNPYENNTQVLAPQAEIQEGSPALRAAPSRPAWTLDNKKNKGEVLVNEAPQGGLLMPTELDEQVEVDAMIQESAMPKIYVVQAGDNLTKIANNNNTSVNAIKDLNSLKNNNIFVGQKLKIPAPQAKKSTASESSSAQSDASANIYVVVSGDSLSKVAAKNKTSVAAIKELNSLTKDTIFVGQKLKLPAPSEKTAAAPAQKKVEGYETYTVARGDYMGAIALKHKMSLAQLKKLNPAVDPNKLQVGQVLVIKEKPLAGAPVVEKTPAPKPQVQAQKTQAPTIAPVVEPTPAPVVEPTPAPAVEPAPAIEAEPAVEEEINILTV